MTTITEKRIGTVKLLQRLRQGDEKPGSTILRALRNEALRSNAAIPRPTAALKMTPEQTRAEIRRLEKEK